MYHTSYKKLEGIVDLLTAAVSSAVQSQRCYGSQSRQLKNEGEKIFLHFVQMHQCYAPLFTAFGSCHTTEKLLPTGLL